MPLAKALRQATARILTKVTVACAHATKSTSASTVDEETRDDTMVATTMKLTPMVNTTNESANEGVHSLPSSAPTRRVLIDK
jgi:hypothetical protein